jgi:HSP20 family molecular chaperone IbpA
MTAESREMEIQEQEMVPDETERTRECQCFVPRADIYEFDENIVVVLDMPGITENAIDITLEKNVLNVKGLAQMLDREGYSLAFAEYEAGDYERSFRISDAIDRDNIDATYKNGVLRLVVPKAEVAKTRKIAVKVG